MLLPTFGRSGVTRKNNTHYQLANQVCANEASPYLPVFHTLHYLLFPRQCRQYASLSPSANSSGTRCRRDQIFSLCSSLKKIAPSQSVILPNPGFHKQIQPDLVHDKVSPASRDRIHSTPHSPLGSTYHLTRFLFRCIRIESRIYTEKKGVSVVTVSKNGFWNED